MPQITVEIGFHRPLWTRAVFKLYILAAKMGFAFDAKWVMNYWKPYTREISSKK